ncbi:MAG TPA: hypothetical protein VGG64_29860 [Pirellulales bacterium]|jgi:hypothetical protein
MRVDGDLVVPGNLVVGGSFVPPNGSIRDANIATNAGIQAEKFIRHQAAEYDVADPATTVANATKSLHIARGAGTIVDFAVINTGTAISGGSTLSIDLQKSTGGAAFATVLASPIALSSSTTLLVAVAATLGALVSFVAGDVFQIMVTTGGSGTQAKGLHATFTYEEAHP